MLTLAVSQKALPLLFLREEKVKKRERLVEGARVCDPCVVLLGGLLQCLWCLASSLDLTWCLQSAGLEQMRIW